MTAHEFLSQFGTLKDVNIHFVKAGNTVIKPVADLLAEYMAVCADPKQAMTGGRSAKKGNKKK